MIALLWKCWLVSNTVIEFIESIKHPSLHTTYDFLSLFLVM